ncbi:MAG: VTT domain-containing protein [Candidatus Sulfotelmatobacter sp.]
MHTFAFILTGGSLWRWVLRLGGPGLILVGLIDNSVVPLPGGMDLFVILLTAHHRDWWPYYGAFATAGAVIGGYVTFRLAKKGGKEGLEKKVGKKRAGKVYRRFEKGGFSTIVVGSILPPPFPLVPVLMAAGVMQYPAKKFLAALALGRGIRFLVVAYLGMLYGTEIVKWLSQYYEPLLYTFIALGVLGGIGALVYFKWYRPKHQPKDKQDQPAKDKKAA